MTDQAQGLRDIVAGLDHAETLPIQSHGEIDYKILWKKLTEELEGEAEGRQKRVFVDSTLSRHWDVIFVDSDESVKSRHFLNRMLQAETIAMTKDVKVTP